MEKKGRSPRTASQVGPRIVRAWFDTVINRLLRALRDEQERLQVENLTWRFQPAAFECVQPVRAFIDPEGSENLEQFLALYPDVKQAVEDHDKTVSLLLEECQQLHRAVEESTALHSLYQKVTSPSSLAELGADLRDIFGAYPPPHHLSVLAQYIVNKTGDLPSYYSTAPLWNKYKEEFLAILDRSPVRDQHDKTGKTGNALLRSAHHLASELEKIRLELSLKHDVPYVAASTKSETWS